MSHSTASMADQETIDSFVVTARKWRPQLFSEVVGQEHISTTLSNALLKNRVHHAYLFCGPRGVGKTTTARIFARALNCTNPVSQVEPCNECESCRDILSGRSMDVIEIDGASNNSVDDVRKLRENAKYPPVHGRYKMYIIDEVHMLSTSAFNALLKTLEEPPPHLLFMFATTESQKVPATIVSRCQRFDFRRMQIDDIVKHLAYIAGEEKVSIDEASLVAIAKKGDGSMRDSQSIFDQVRAFCGDTIVISELSSALHLIDEEFFFSISDAISAHDAATMFDLVRQLVTRGYDIHECLSGLTEHFRNLLSIIATKETSLIESSSATIARYRESAKNFGQADVLRILTLINTADSQLRYSAQPRFRLELLLVQLASLDSTVEIAQLLNEVRELKKNGSKIGMIAAPVHATMPSPPATRTSPPVPLHLEPGTPPPIAPSISSSQAASGFGTNSASAVNGRNASSPASSYVPKNSTPAPKFTPGAGIPPMGSTMGGRSISAQAGGGAAQSVKAQVEQQLERNLAQTYQEGPIVAGTVLQAGWSEFVKNLPLSLAAIKLSLNSREVCSVRFFDGEVLVMNSEKFMCDDFNARRAPLSQQLEKFYGSSVRVRVVHTQNIHELVEQSLDEESGGAAGNLASTNSSNASQGGYAEASETQSSIKQESSQTNQQTNQHPSQHTAQPMSSNSAGGSSSDKLPIEKSLVELFGAKKIPLQRS